LTYFEAIVTEERAVTVACAKAAVASLDAARFYWLGRPYRESARDAKMKAGK
jgi:hypothetical protein